MKRCKLFMLVAIAAFAVSCVTPSERISDFVAKVETDCDSYSADDWERIDAEFDRLCTDIESNYVDWVTDRRFDILRCAWRRNHEIHKTIALKKADNKICYTIRNHVRSFRFISFLDPCLKRRLESL